MSKIKIVKRVVTSIAALSAAAFIGTSFVACGDIKTDKQETSNTNKGSKIIKIGYLPITHALALFEEKKLLEESSSDIQIELVKFSSWPDLMDALNANKIDGASVLIELAMNAKSTGVDLKAISLGHKDGNVVVVSNSINSPTDLNGKTFAIPSVQSSHNILFNELLAKNSISPSDIKIIQLAPTEMPSALASGSIDGYCVAEPFGAQAVATGIGKVLSYSEDLWTNSSCCALVLNNSFIKENESLTKIFADKFNEAGKVLEDKAKAKEIASQYLGQNEEVLETSLKWITYDKLKITEEDYKVLCDKVKKYKINDNPPSFTDFVYK